VAVLTYATHLEPGRRCRPALGYDEWPGSVSNERTAAPSIRDLMNSPRNLNGPSAAAHRTKRLKLRSTTGKTNLPKYP